MKKYKYCLCVKVKGKWKEIIYYNKKRNELQYVNTYYRDICSYGILTLKHFANHNKKYKIRNRLIKLNYAI